MSKRSRYSNGSARRKLRARVRAEGRSCAICGRAIDYTLPARHPMSFELDEIVPFSQGGSAIDYNNVQPAHRICNQRKSNKLNYCLPAVFKECEELSEQQNVNAISDW